MQLDAQRATLAASLTDLNQSARELADQQREMQHEMAKSCPVRDLAEVDEAMENPLRNLGIRTVEALSMATPEDVAERGRMDIATATRMINAAQGRLAR